VKHGWRRVFAGAFVAAATATSPGFAGEALTVCLDRNVPLGPISDRKDGGGFDFAVAQGVAIRLGRPLRVQWFETGIDEDSSTTLAANALLSDGRCRLVGGYPLVADGLGRPAAATARLPDYDGKTPSDRGRRVALGALVPSRPYHYAPLTIVLGGTATLRPVSGLADIAGMKIGVEDGTLADAILMLFEDGRLVGNLTHVVPGRGDLLVRLERGDFAVSLVDLRRFDAYRAAHPATRLRRSGYYYPIGFNMGFVALSTQQELLVQVNAAVGDMLAKAELPGLARDSGITYLPPRQPDILAHVTLADLRH
jgi:hypothetical protein